MMYQNYSISVSNFTDWSFAQPNKTVAHHSDSYISMGQTFLQNNYTLTDAIYVTNVEGSASTFAMDGFGFGQVVNSTQSFESILNNFTDLYTT